MKTLPGVPLSDISEQYVDELLDFQKEGLMVKSIRKSGEKVILNFKSDEDRANAVRLIESKITWSSSLIESTYIPAVTFPTLVKLTNVSDSFFPPFDDNLETRTAREKDLLAKIKEENPSFSQHLVSLKILYVKRCPSALTFFYLVRLCSSSAHIRNDLISEGKLLFENLAHRVALPNANKEVRRCLRCQKIRTQHQVL